MKKALNPKNWSKWLQIVSLPFLFVILIGSIPFLFIWTGFIDPIWKLSFGKDYGFFYKEQQEEHKKSETELYLDRLEKNKEW